MLLYDHLIQNTLPRDRERKTEGSFGGGSGGRDGGADVEALDQNNEYQTGVWMGV